MQCQCRRPCQYSVSSFMLRHRALSSPLLGCCSGAPPPWLSTYCPLARSLPLLPKVRHDTVDVGFVLSPPILRPRRSLVGCIISFVLRVSLHLYPGPSHSMSSYYDGAVALRNPHRLFVLCGRCTVSHIAGMLSRRAFRQCMVNLLNY